jgi:hypothetical protein
MDKEDKTMRDSASYSKFENQIIHKYRNSLNHAESVEDVKKFFSYTMQELMHKVFEDKLRVDLADIQLNLDADKPFVISQTLQQHTEFHRIWSTSDLPLIMSRLAIPAQNRFAHLQGHPEKTKAKIHRH